MTPVSTLPVQLHCMANTDAAALCQQVSSTRLSAACLDRGAAAMGTEHEATDRLDGMLDCL